MVVSSFIRSMFKLEQGLNQSNRIMVDEPNMRRNNFKKKKTNYVLIRWALALYCMVCMAMD